jgi:hypothetical protein
MGDWKLEVKTNSQQPITGNLQRVIGDCGMRNADWESKKRIQRP